eukprot:TRINITY_DN8775_c0_g1_i1.p1 TRINITY_DN8775_c0_g1~~TRINITY_DN8775_c0_g1_i1.p1  ORF type:complete len:659 (-),score=133.23 TRINITY_DN8775_c0_g1_i1:459-2330(-)
MSGPDMREINVVPQATTDSEDDDTASFVSSAERKRPAADRLVWGIGGATALVATGGVVLLLHERLDFWKGQDVAEVNDLMLPENHALVEECCHDATAACRACLVGESVEEFCMFRSGRAADIPGCEGVSSCCSDNSSAVCGACHEKTTLAQFCEETTHEALDGCQCENIEQDVQYLEGDIYNMQVSEAAECCYACEEEPKCTSWTFVPSAGKCMLKSQVQLKRVYSKGQISGMKASKEQWYQIKLMHGICLTSEERKKDQATSPLWLSTCDNQAQEHWQLFLYNPISGRITDQAGMCVDVGVNSTVGSRINMAPCDEVVNTSRLEWDYYGDSLMKHRSSQKCLGATEATTEGAHLFLHECAPPTNPQVQFDVWLVAPVANPLTIHPAYVKNNISNKSVYCIAAMLPWGGELQLLRMQLANKWGIFSCEDYDVYSNVVLDLGGFATRMVYTNLHCNYGKTVFNTPVFQHFWRQVAADGRYLEHDWTVKVDPDTMLIPQRLHYLLNNLDNNEPNIDDVISGKGLYLSDCSNGLHGPIETLSRQAVETFYDDGKNCPGFPQEDVYLRACLDTIGVGCRLHEELLGEMHCHFPGWHQCVAPRVAFHPFKSVDEWSGCHERATNAIPI